MRIEISTILDCPPAMIWREALTSRLLEYVTYPLAVFAPVDPPKFPIKWDEGKYFVKIRLGGLIPFGQHCINISIPEADTARASYRIRDNGCGDVISKWDHLISIRASQSGKTLYTDTVEIRAGLFTPFVWIYARIFYGYRQKRWRRLVATGFKYGERGPFASRCVDEELR